MSKKVSKKEDTISQLKKEEEKAKKVSKNKEEIENSEDEEDEKDKNENAIKEQTVQKADKPGNIKELLDSMGDNKPKSKKTTNKTQKKKYDEPSKLKFVNTKGTANADKIDSEIKNKMNLDKKVFKNAKGLDAAAKENQKIKPTKNYLEKDVEIKYKEDNVDVAKPQFTSNKEDGENFVELNKSEDVRNILFITINYMLMLIVIG